MALPVPSHEDFTEGVATPDVVIDAPETDRDSKKLPILLHFHGGGFCISQPDWYMYYHVYTRLARSAWAICVSIYLRLPAACHDGFSALLWLLSVAQATKPEPWLKVHADCDRVFLVGDSSGENLVHEVAAHAGEVDLGPVKRKIKVQACVVVRSGGLIVKRKVLGTYPIVHRFCSLRYQTRWLYCNQLI